MKIPFTKKELLFQDKKAPPKKSSKLTTQIGYVGQEPKKEYFQKKPDMDDIYEMRQDPTIKIGLSVIKHPMQRAEWNIVCEKAEISNFVEDNFRPLWDEFFINLLSAIDFGKAVFEKIFAYKNSYLQYKKLLALRPETVSVYFSSKTGEVTRVRQSPQDDISLQAESKKEKTDDIPPEKVFIYTHQKEFASVEGESRLTGVYPYWLMCSDIYKYANIFYHRFAIPLVRGWAPRGETTVGSHPRTGEAIKQDNLQWWMSALANIHEATTLVHEYSEGEEWGIEIHEPKESGVRYLEYIEHLNIMKLVALFVPELTVMKGVRGSYALGKEQTELFLDNEEAILKEIKGQIDEFLIAPLVKLNFGENAPKAYWTYQPISRQVKTYIAKVFELLTNALGNRGISYVDYKKLGERLGIPIKGEEEEIEEKVEKGAPALEQELKEIALKEKGVTQWREEIAKDSKKLEKKLTEVVDKQLSFIIKSVRSLLEDDKANIAKRVRKLLIPYSADYADILFSDIVKSFEKGKKSVSDELGIQYDKAFPRGIHNLLRSRSSAVANRHASDLLYLTELTILDNLYENVTNKDILLMVSQQFDKFKANRVRMLAGNELMNAFNIGRSYVADKHVAM